MSHKSAKKRRQQERRAAIRRQQEEQHKANQTTHPDGDNSATTQQTADSLGQGDDRKPDSFLGDDPSKKDLRLATRAIKEEWEIPDAIRPSFVPEAAVVYFDRTRDIQARLAAGRLILVANGQNLKERQNLQTMMTVEQALVYANAFFLAAEKVIKDKETLHRLEAETLHLLPPE